MSNLLSRRDAAFLGLMVIAILLSFRRNLAGDPSSFAGIWQSQSKSEFGTIFPGSLSRVGVPYSVLDNFRLVERKFHSDDYHLGALHEANSVKNVNNKNINNNNDNSNANLKSVHRYDRSGVVQTGAVRPVFAVTDSVWNKSLQYVERTLDQVEPK
jgi:hypothetical protein